MSLASPGRHHTVLLWSPQCENVRLLRKTTEPYLQRRPVCSCQAYYCSLAGRRQIVAQGKLRGQACNSSSPRPTANSQQDTRNGQLFFDLLLVWQQLSSRFSGAESHEARLLLTALKLTIAAQRSQQRDGLDHRPQAQRAVAVAMLLSDLSASGVPVDAHSIAAAMVIEAVSLGQIPMHVLHRELGMQVCVLVHEIQRVRAAPLSIEVYDEESSAAVREQCLALCDVRAVVIEVVCRLEQLQNCQAVSIAKQQVLALQVLQIFSPLAHAVGLSVASARLEDLSFEILFGDAYLCMRTWMHGEQDRWLAVLACMKAQAQEALNRDDQLRKLAVHAHVSTRAKSSYSLMKKLLTLSDFSRAGKSIDETYDVLGMRVIVESASEEPLDDVIGRQGCFRAERILQELFRTVPNRRKNYIEEPKPNGYESLHMAVEVPEEHVLEASGLLEPGARLQGQRGRGAAAGGTVDMMEIQIRTASMHAAAEQGDTSHTLYKSGVDMRRSARLHDWTQALMHAFSATQASFRMEQWASPPTILEAATHPSAAIPQVTPLATSAPPQHSQSLSGFSSVLREPLDSPDYPYVTPARYSGPAGVPAVPRRSGSAPPPVHVRELGLGGSATSRSHSLESSVGTLLLKNIPEAPGAPQPELLEEAVRQLFDHLDHNGDGEISTEEIQKVLKDLGGDSAAAEASTVVSMLTQQRAVDGRVTFDDLLRFQRRCAGTGRLPSAQLEEGRQPVAALPDPGSQQVQQPARTSMSAVLGQVGEYTGGGEVTHAHRDVGAGVGSDSGSGAPMQVNTAYAAQPDVNSAVASHACSVDYTSHAQGGRWVERRDSQAPLQLQRQIGHALRAAWSSAAVPLWRLPLVRGMPCCAARCSPTCAASLHAGGALQRRSLAAQAAACVLQGASRQRVPIESAPCIQLWLPPSRQVSMRVGGLGKGGSRAAVETLETSTVDGAAESDDDTAEEDTLGAGGDVATGAEDQGQSREGRADAQNGRDSRSLGSSPRSSRTAAKAGRGSGSSASVGSASSSPAPLKASTSTSAASGTTAASKQGGAGSNKAAGRSTRKPSSQPHKAGQAPGQQRPAPSKAAIAPQPPASPRSPSPTPTPTTAGSAQQPTFKWAAQDPLPVKWEVPLMDPADAPPLRRLRTSATSSSPPQAPQSPLSPEAPPKLRNNNNNINDDSSTSSNHGATMEAAMQAALLSDTLYTEDEADVLADAAQQSILDSIDLDQIPGGLGAQGWEASDIVAVASESARELKNASMYTLELDDVTSELLDNALGAVVYAEGITALLVPARGPLVVGAQKFRGCDVVVSEARLSGRHVFFEVREAANTEPQLTVTDMGSTNGVFVNGKRCEAWKPRVARIGDVVHLSSQVARFRVGSLKKEGLKEASTIAALIDDLKADKLFMSDRAWRTNKLQRLALSCVLYPSTTLSKSALQNSGTPSVALALPKTSLKDVAQAALPLAAWATIDRDKKVRDFLRKGQIPKTFQFIKQMTVNYPTDPRGWLFLAELRLCYDRDYPAARVACRAALEACGIARMQLQKLINAGYHHEDRLHRIDLIWLHALTTAAVVEWQAKLYTPARRLFDAALREASTCGVLAVQFVAWTWADCELQQGRAAIATEVLNRALHKCKTPALILLLAKAEMKAGKQTRAKKRLARLSERFPFSPAVAFSHASACIDMDAPMRALRLLQTLRPMRDSCDIDASMRAVLHACEARALVALGKTEQAVYQISDAVRMIKTHKAERKDIQSHEWHHWLDLKDPRQSRALPHLVVQTFVRSAQHDNVWADIEIAQARLELAEAVVDSDPAASFELSREVVASGKLQVAAHCAAARAALGMMSLDAKFAPDARKHLAAGLRLDANNLGMLGAFVRWLEVQRDAEGARAVRLLLQEMKRLGAPGRVAAEVQAPAHDAIDMFLWSGAKK